LLQDLVGLCEHCHHARHFPGDSKMGNIEKELARKLGNK
jgi:5-methylcytosine-specific restriction endonuclease McrA